MAEGPPSERPTLFRPLRLRDARLLWGGMTASLLGDGVFVVALAWQVYTVSSAPAALAAVGLAMSIPHVAFLLVGGVVSDRADRGRVMVAADLVRGAAMAAMALLAWGGSRSVVPIAAVAVVYGGATAFFGPAFDAIVPEVVPPDLLASANSLDQLLRPLAARLIGPAVGGWIVAAFGAGAAFLLDAATFAASALAVAAMARPAVDRGPDDGPASALGEIREGYRYVRGHVWLWGTFAAATVAYLLFMGPTEVLVPFLVKTTLHGSAGTLGTVFAAGGLGAVAAAVVISNRRMPRRFIRFMYLTWGLATFAVAGYGLAKWPWEVMAACFAFNALETAGTIVWATAKHRLVPARLLGRVSSFDWFISIGLVPVSFALTGPVAAAVGVRGTLVGAGVLGGTVTVAALLLPGLRGFEQTHGEALHAPQEDPSTLRPAPVMVP